MRRGDGARHNPYVHSSGSGVSEEPGTLGGGGAGSHDVIDQCKVPRRLAPALPMKGPVHIFAALSAVQPGLGKRVTTTLQVSSQYWNAKGSGGNTRQFKGLVKATLV